VRRTRRRDARRRARAIRRRASWSPLAAALAFATAGCGDAATGPFEGARPIVLESVRQGCAPTPDEIERLVAAVLDVAGGAERLERLRWRRVEDLYLSHTATLFSNQVVCTTLVRHDRSIRVQLDYREGFNELRVLFRGEEYLRPRRESAAAGALELATGATQQYVEWDWEIARLPVILLEAASLAPLPPRIEEGRALVGMKVDVPDFHPKFEAWIDPAGPMVVEVRATLPITADLTARAEADLCVRFSSFRRVKGVLFPFRRDLFVDGRRFGLADARSIEIDVELRDEEFMAR